MGGMFLWWYQMLYSFDNEGLKNTKQNAFPQSLHSLVCCLQYNNSCTPVFGICPLPLNACTFFFEYGNCHKIGSLSTYRKSGTWCWVLLFSHKVYYTYPCYRIPTLRMFNLDILLWDGLTCCIWVARVSAGLY